MTANDHTNFSLVIACYNESKNIPLLFDEISECQKKEFEVIIINNGSTDNSKVVLKKTNIS